MSSVPPSTRTQGAIDELLEGDRGDPRSTLLGLASQYIVEETLEAKTRELRGGG